MILQAFSLGLSAGLFCMARCVPTLAPLLVMSPQKGFKAGVGLVGVFLCGRLIAYCSLGVAAGLAGNVLGDLPYSLPFLGATQIALGSMLAVQAVYRCTGRHCPGKRMVFGTKKTIFFAGLLSSLALCPPILLAISMAMENGSLVRGILFFLIFFLATSLYVVPVSLAAVNLNHKILLFCTRIVCLGTGIYFIWNGVAILFIEQRIVF